MQMRLTSKNFITRKRTWVAHLILIADCCCSWSKQCGNRLTTKEKCLREGSRGVLQAAGSSWWSACAGKSLLRWSSCLPCCRPHPLPLALARVQWPGQWTRPSRVSLLLAYLPTPLSPHQILNSRVNTTWNTDSGTRSRKTLYCHRWLFSVHELSQHLRDSPNIINGNSMTEAGRRWCYEFLSLI